MDKLTINGAVAFSFFDEQGRILTVRCGRLDADHLVGWFALLVNNIEVFRTNNEPISQEPAYLDTHTCTRFVTTYINNLISHSLHLQR